MRVYIGPYKSWFGPYQLVNMLFWYLPLDTRDKISEWLPKAPFDYLDRFRKRGINVHIDDYDVWNMDSTLAHIILPMLVILKEEKDGIPDTDVSDAPEGLDDENRWNYILDEMIYAFKSISDPNTENQFYTGKSSTEFVPINPEETDPEKRMYEMVKKEDDTFVIDHEGLSAHNKRVQKGLLLFGKYYQCLWT